MRMNQGLMDIKHIDSEGDHGRWLPCLRVRYREVTSNFIINETQRDDTTTLPSPLSTSFYRATEWDRIMSKQPAGRTQSPSLVARAPITD